MNKKPNKSPFDKGVQHEQKRLAILSEASYLFNVQGTRATTLNQVAERLELTKSSLYYYVKTKNELVYLCYIATCDHIEQQLNQVQQPHLNGREQLSQFVLDTFQNWQAILAGTQPYYSILNEIPNLEQKHRDEVIRRYRIIFGRIQNIIEKGIEDSSFTACEPISTTTAFFGTLQYSVIWIDKFPGEQLIQAGKRFLDILLYGLATQPVNFNKQPKPNFEEQFSGFNRMANNQSKQEAFFKMGSDYFNQKGFKGTSLDEIAMALNVTKGAFYYHIKNKDDLLIGCFERTIALTQAIQAQASNLEEKGLSKLVQAAFQLFSIQLSEQGPLVRYSLVTSLPAQSKLKVILSFEEISDKFGDFIKQGINDGSIQAVDQLIAEYVISGAIDTSQELKRLLSIDDISSAASDYFHLLVNGLAGSP